MQKSDIFLSFMRSCVFDRDFQQRHRTKSSAFSRDRKLTFPRVILFLIQKYHIFYKLNFYFYYF